MAAHCPSCGQKLCWAKREYGSWHPALEFVQVALVIGRDDGVVREELVWQQHTCLDAEVDPLQARRSRQKSEYQAARERAHWLAMSVPCPTCAAKIGDRCINLTRREAGINVPTASPHPPRLRAAQTMTRKDGSERPS